MNGLIEDTSAGTLIESIVALALLLTVLLPAGAFLGELTLNLPASLRSEALALARTELESTIASASFSQEDRWTENRRYRVTRSVQRTEKRVTISVRVYRRDSTNPLVHLSTIRRIR